jgi:hypothetical protein
LADGTQAPTVVIIWSPLSMLTLIGTGCRCIRAVPCSASHRPVFSASRLIR